MTLGALLLLFAALLAAAGLAAFALRPAWAAWLARAHAAAALLAFAVLVIAFLAGDLGYAYVWGHTRLDYGAPYRLAGVWGGEEGTLLLWNAAEAALLVALLRKEGAPHRGAAAFLLAMSGSLSLANLLAGAFDATDAARLAVAPQGRGLADVLLTPLMVIHPPVQFLGYALMAVPAAYALASWAGRDDERAWVEPAMGWARRAWLFATLGLGLGALWAYYVLSFGGYWAWDPVETSNLLPWLALTGFLHAGKQLQKLGDHALAAPSLAFGAHALTLFATFATRSGLWVSVHAFTDPTNRFEPDAGARLLAILDAHPESRLLMGILLATFLGGLGLFALHASRRVAGPARPYLAAHGALLVVLAGAGGLDPAFVLGAALQLAGLAPFGGALVALALLALPAAVAFVAGEEGRRGAALDQRTLMSVAVGLLAVALVVALLLDLQVVNGPDRRLFDGRAPFVALPLVTALTLVLALPTGRRVALALAGGGLLAGVVASVALPQARTLALAAPPLAAGVVAALLRLAGVQGASQARLRLAGILVGLASILGLVMWGNPPTWVRGLALPEGASLALGFAGVALASLGLVGAFLAWRGRAWRVALGGAAASALVAGYGAGAALGLAGLVLVARERGAFEPPAWRALGPRLRETGIYLVHLALLLSLLGYAASTYSQERDVFAAQPLDAQLHVRGHELSLAPAQVAADGQRRAQEVVVPVRLAGEGEIPLRFAWEGTHYEGTLEVRRALLEDVYVTPLAYHTASGWVGANSAGEKAPAEPVDAVTFSVSVLPLVTLVWSGLWGMLLGMALILAGARLAR